MAGRTVQGVGQGVMSCLMVMQQMWVYMCFVGKHQ